MEGVRQPGYYPSVTGSRPDGQRRGFPKPGDAERGPVTLYGQVHRYGPKNGNPLLMLIGRPDVERVWKGEEYPAPPVSSPEFSELLDVCMAEAQAEAERLNKLDPKGLGLERVARTKKG